MASLRSSVHVLYQAKMLSAHRALTISSLLYYCCGSVFLSLSTVDI